jgi:hypothetical protein
LLLAEPGCRVDDDGPPSNGEPDAGDTDAGEVDAGEVDAGAVDAALAIDASPDAAVDARIDGMPPPGWGLAFSGDNAMDIVTVGDRTYLATIGDAPPFLMRLRTIVGGQLTSTETLVNAGGRLGTDGESLFVSVGVYGVVTLWNEQVGVAGRNTVVVAKMGANGLPLWRYVDSDGTVDDYRVGADGTSAMVFTRRVGGVNVRTIDVLDASGVLTHQWTLPEANAFVVDDDGDVFVSGVLRAGASLEGHVAAADESYLIKLAGDTVGFTRFLPGVTHEVVGIHAGEPVLASRLSGDLHAIALHSGADGASRWATQVEGGGAQFRRRVSSDGHGTLYMFGRFQDRLVFSPTVRVDGQTDSDAYVAELDAISGMPRNARRFGSAGYDEAVELEAGGCPLIAGTLRGELVHGQGVAAIPAGGRGAFVATACR